MLSLRFHDPDESEGEINCLDPGYDPSMLRDEDDVINPLWFARMASALHADPTPPDPGGPKMQTCHRTELDGGTAMTGPRLSRAARRRASVAAVATALVLFAAACSSAPTPATTPSATTAAASGLKTIDKAALQSLVDETAASCWCRATWCCCARRKASSRPRPAPRNIGEQKLPTVDTHFRIASVTKTMTSAATLLLAQEGKLRLDDPVSKYVPEVPNGDNITIAQLLEMRSGLYSFTDSDTHLNEPRQRPDQGVDAARAAGHRLRPAAELRARRRLRVQQHQLRAARPDRRDSWTGKPLATVFEDRLFKPLGMTNTMFPPPRPAPSPSRSRTGTCTAAPRP